MLKRVTAFVLIGMWAILGWTVQAWGESAPSPKKESRPPVVLFNMEKYFAGMTQIPDGSLKAYLRNDEGKLASVTFSDDGLTVSEPTVEDVGGQMPEKGAPNLMTLDGELHAIHPFFRQKAQRPGGAARARHYEVH